jgi:hypothetical protein
MTRFNWNFAASDDIGVLQIEEFKDNLHSSNKFCSRYLHSIRNRNLKKFTHIDGAIKTYQFPQNNLLPLGYWLILT